MLTVSFLLLFTAFNHVAAIQSRYSNDTLKPWEVSSVFVIQRSPTVEKPGAFWFNITISDPQMIVAKGSIDYAPSGSWCSISSADSVEEAYGSIETCYTDCCFESNQWTREVLNSQDTNGNSSVDNSFSVSFTRAASFDLTTGKVWKTFVGVGRFTPNYNLDAVCNDFGTDCTFQLKKEFTPMYINQTMTSCQGDCDHFH
jgi:hypothetical protein